MAGAEITKPKVAPKYAKISALAHLVEFVHLGKNIAPKSCIFASKNGVFALADTKKTSEKRKIRSEKIQICSEERKICADLCRKISEFHICKSKVDANLRYFMPVGM